MQYRRPAIHEYTLRPIIGTGGTNNNGNVTQSAGICLAITR